MFAFYALRSCLTGGSEKFNRRLVWPGDHGEFTLYWQEYAGFWVVFGQEGHSRYWCAYGTMDPKSNSSLKIGCEINPPTGEINRHSGGIFLKDSDSRLYLSHFGEFGGGRKGIGKTPFLDIYEGKTEEIEWPDGVTLKVVVIGKIGDESFLGNLASYIMAVEDFKTGETCRTPNGATIRRTKHDKARDRCAASA